MLGVACLFWAGLTGHLLTVIVLVIVPQRLAGMALAWAFDYLPHHELTATARQDEFQATRNRIGMEWLMTPLLLSQNYHQIHHLHPSIPFYRYLAVWRRNEREYVRRGASLTTIMGKVISPQHYLARVGVPDTINEHRRFYPLTVTRVQRPTTDSVAVTLSVPEDLRPVFAYRPGQHVTVQADIAGTTVRRSYSICVSMSCRPPAASWRIPVVPGSGDMAPSPPAAASRRSCRSSRRRWMPNGIAGSSSCMPIAMSPASCFSTSCWRCSCNTAIVWRSCIFCPVPPETRTRLPIVAA
jgi:hypothetical protein